MMIVNLCCVTMRNSSTAHELGVLRLVDERSFVLDRTHIGFHQYSMFGLDYLMWDGVWQVFACGFLLDDKQRGWPITGKRISSQKVALIPRVRQRPVLARLYIHAYIIGIDVL